MDRIARGGGQAAIAEAQALIARLRHREHVGNRADARNEPSAQPGLAAHPVTQAGVAWAVDHVAAVLYDRVLHDATVVAENGVIVSIEQSRRGSALPGAIDGQGAFLLPGIIDLHSTGLEQELGLGLRRRATVPVGFALSSFEGRARAAGVTALYHRIGFSANGHQEHLSPQAEELCARVWAWRRRESALVDHQILCHLNGGDRPGLEALIRYIDAAAPSLMNGEPLGPVPLVSIDAPASDRERRCGTRSFHGSSLPARRSAQADEHWACRNEHSTHKVALALLGDEAKEGRIRLFAHRPASLAEVEHLATIGACTAEFPTTLAVAAAAAERGMHIVMGAPHVTSGNLTAANAAPAELVHLGLCTALAGEGLPSALLGAVFLLVAEGVVGLPEAIRLVSAGPAAVADLPGRGRLEPGYRADAVLVTVEQGWPTVHRAWRAPHAVGGPW